MKTLKHWMGHDKTADAQFLKVLEEKELKEQN